MTLDQVLKVHQGMRTKSLNNIGVTLVKLGRYGDAMNTFEDCLDQQQQKNGINEHRIALLTMAAYCLGSEEKMREAFQRLVDISPPTTSIDEQAHDQELDVLFTDSTKVNNHNKIQPNLSELEGSQWSSESTGPQNVQLASCGLVLEDEFRGSKFELVGDGRNYKALETNDQKNAVWHCQCFKLEEFCQIFEIMARMQGVATDYGEEDFLMIRNMLLPIEQPRIIHSPQRRGLVYILLPDHQGILHQLLEENELSCLNGGPARLSEERAQPILKQVALLIDFCHRIGLYFRDFQLSKFVFTDSEKTQIRVNNVLDLYLAPKGTNISVISREFIPAYIAPELIDKKNEQCRGKASDIWAFGVSIFTLLNGRYLFFESNRSPITLLRRIRAHRFSFPINETILAAQLQPTKLMAAASDDSNDELEDEETVNNFFENEKLFEKLPIGVGMGLTTTATFYVETMAEIGLPRINIFGSNILSTMKESIQIAHIVARNFLKQKDPKNTFFETRNIHLNIPQIPKHIPFTGSSAGVVFVSTLISQAIDQPIPTEVAMTGEISLLGIIVKVGGINQKLKIAKKAGFKKMIMPKSNEEDYEKSDELGRQDMEVEFVSNYEELFKIIFPRFKPKMFVA